MAVDLLGIALGFAIQLGLSIVLGALAPMVWARAFRLESTTDWLFILGLAVMVLGVILCAQAGGKKETSGESNPTRFRLELIIALIGGVLAPTLNFGIQYGADLLRQAGEVPANRSFPVGIYLAWQFFSALQPWSRQDTASHVWSAITRSTFSDRELSVATLCR